MAAGHDIFISYASVDRERARTLAGLFATQGWKLWWDPEIPPGEPFDRVIKRALDAARVVVVLWSRTSVESDWVLAEADEGRKRQALVPILLDAVDIPLGFRRLQAANLVGWSGDAGHPELRKLLAKIAKLLAAPVGDGTGETVSQIPATPDTQARAKPRGRRRLWLGAGAAAVVLALAAYLGNEWYESIRFERHLNDVRQHIQWADADMAAERKREARQKLDAARQQLDRAERLRPGTWQTQELERLHSMARRRLLGRDLTPNLKLYQDCPECPEMIELPAGAFTMGSDDGDAEAYAAERPKHAVAIARPFAIGRFEVTVHEFSLFVRAENYAPTADCRVYVHPDRWQRDLNASWKWPQYSQGPDHPVACVSWHDARKYAEWLSRKTGKTYRLPTEAEWEYAARAGGEAARPWGGKPSEACKSANVADEAARVPWPGHDCRDNAAFTAAAGSYDPNAFGLFDMIGNVWEWVEDCFADSYAGAPNDGGASPQAACKFRVIRGGAWLSRPRDARSAQRGLQSPDYGNYSVGFRLVREQ